MAAADARKPVPDRGPRFADTTLSNQLVARNGSLRGRHEPARENLRSRIFSGDGVPFSGRSLAQIDMGYQYRSPVIVSDGSTDTDPPGADYQQTATPGCRAPHLWLADGTSTIDLFDQRFVLLTAEPGSAWRDAAARRPGIPVDSHVVTELGWSDLYGVAPDDAVLVRPDGHVA